MTKEQEVLHSLGIHTWQELTPMELAPIFSTKEDINPRRICMGCGLVQRYSSAYREWVEGTPTRTKQIQELMGVHV